jgi:hypothetical protein
MRRTDRTRIRRVALSLGTALVSLLTLASGVLAGSGGSPFPK